jgi:hypothetical protein
MLRYLRYFTTAGIIAIAIEGSIAMGQMASAITVPSVPAELQVPAGNTAFLKGHAVGTQNYVCRSTPSGISWTLFGPQATLFVTIKWINGEIQQQIMTHFLSPNPDESGRPRPTWQGSLDTSAVWGNPIASSMDPRYVAPGAIAWLLLQVVGAERGPAGGAVLTPTTYIHRLNTSGGVMPATGCSQASDLGATAIVPYATDYFFYKASQ